MDIDDPRSRIVQSKLPRLIVCALSLWSCGGGGLYLNNDKKKRTIKIDKDSHFF